jgi:hypothetical protein
MRILWCSTDKISAVSILLAGWVLTGLGGPAMAQTATYNLNQSQAFSGLNAGTVTTTQLSPTEIQITLQLNSGFGLHETTSSNHYAFYFNTYGNVPVTVSGLPAGFTLNPLGSYGAPPFSGAFNYAISCARSACGTGGPGYTGTLTFDITSSNGKALSLSAPATYNNQQLYFAVDLVNTGGSVTGNVGAVASPH